MAVAVIGDCSAPTKTCITIWENFPMHRASDMKGEMMSQIDRQAAIEALYSIDEYNPRSIKAIKDLPSLHPESKWIPCSERLPEAKQRVLVTFPDGTVDIKICIDAGHLKWFFAHMTAWMPLPEPYEPYDYNYERAVEQLEHDILYEPTFNQDDGSM